MLSIPRPGQESAGPQAPVPGPSESSFTSTFGHLLPPAQFLTTAHGKAAYYEMLPSNSQDDLKSTQRVLFIHGVQTPALGMLPLARTLHESFPHAHLVLMDLWGHGLSDTPIVPHEPQLFHLQIDALLDELNWNSAHLVGYSFGGILTVGYALSRRARVQSYTLVGPAGLIPYARLSAEDQAHLNSDDAQEAEKWVLTFLEGGELHVPSDWKERVAQGEVVAPAVRQWQIDSHRGHMASVLAIIRDGEIFDRDAEFAQVSHSGVPYCIVAAEKDGFSRAEDLRRVGFENVSVVPDAEHDVVRTRVPAVASIIKEFWQGLGFSA